MADTLLLATGLFPDRQRLDEAIAALDVPVRRLDLVAARTAEDWDAVAAAVLAARTVLTL